jgi:hypothetical protein
MNIKIRFKGEDYIFTGDTLEGEGAITTPEAYSNFEDSYAHLYSNGEIKRYGEVIGHREDIIATGLDFTECAEAFLERALKGQ